MKHMMLVKILDVFTGNDVDFGIPIVVESIKSLELGLLFRCYVGEVFKELLHEEIVYCKV